MKKIITLTALLAGLILPATAAEPEEAKPSAEAKKLAGVYKIVSGEQDGEVLPQDRLDGTVRIGMNSISGYDEDENKLYTATYQLDTQSEPWKINLVGTIVPAGEDKEAERFVRKGLIKKDGKTVTLIYSLEDGQVPDDFEAEDGQHKFVFEELEEPAEKDL